MEQTAVIKFCGEECLSRTSVSEWHKTFKESSEIEYAKNRG
jgi:hypothetical protein